MPSLSSRIACLAALAGACPLLIASQPLEPVVEQRSPLQPTTAPRAQGVVPGQPSAADAIAGLGRRDLPTGQGALVREGTFLVERRAAIVRSRTGELIAVFGTTPESDPPMVLLPSQTLSGMESLLEGVSGQVIGELSGEVTIYQGRNYMLPTAYRLELAEQQQPSEQQPTEQQPTDQGMRDAPSDPLADPRVEALIRDLESGRARRPMERSAPTTAPTDALRGGSPSAGTTEPVAGPPEGTLIVRQRGRLDRLTGGRLAFVADGDLDQPPPPALVLMPNGRLQALDRLVETRGLELELELSGRVFRSDRTGLLLVSSFVVLPPERESEITPIQ